MRYGIAKKYRKVFGKFEVKSKVKCMWTNPKNIVYGNGWRTAGRTVWGVEVWDEMLVRQVWPIRTPMITISSWWFDREDEDHFEEINFIWRNLFDVWDCQRSFQFLCRMDIL